MRIVDADRLYDQVEARYRQSSGEEHRAERLLLDAICNSPTIDAIPAEWIVKQTAVAKELGDMSCCYAFRRLVGVWQKEQETR